MVCSPLPPQTTFHESIPTLTILELASKQLLLDVISVIHRFCASRSMIQVFSGLIFGQKSEQKELFMK